MMFNRSCLLAAMLLLLTACQASLVDYAARMPACGLSCLAQTIPASECKTFTNDTCICTSSQLLAANDECTSKTCSVLERLQLAQLSEEACGKSKQARRPEDLKGLGFLDGLSLVFIVMRLAFRYSMAGKMEADDWILVAMALVWIPFTALGVVLRIEAIGYNIWDLDVDTITRALKYFFIDELFYTLTLALLRISILVFFMRVFPMPKFNIICKLTMGWVIISSTIVIFMTLFQCIPLNYNWEGWTGAFPGEPRCLDVNALVYAAAASGIIQDLAILILPLPVIASLQLPLRKKLLSLVMFSLGIFIIITSCARLKSLVAFSKSMNPTWDNVDAVLWTSLEVNITVVVACLPVIRVFLSRLFPKVFGTTNNLSRKSVSKHLDTNSEGSAYAGLPDSASPRTLKFPSDWDGASIELHTGLGPEFASSDAELTSIHISGTTSLVAPATSTVADTEPSRSRPND